jgi:hypothetical protein
MKRFPANCGYLANIRIGLAPCRLQKENIEYRAGQVYYSRITGCRRDGHVFTAKSLLDLDRACGKKY